MSKQGAGADDDRTLFYEDLTYGRQFTSGTRQIAEADLLLFGELSGDHNPLHMDAEYAATTRFGQRVVHGPLGIAITMGLLYELGILERSALALLDVEWRFVAPIFVGDELSMTMTITSRRLTANRDAGVVGRFVRLRKQDGTTVQEGTLGLLVRVGDLERAQREEDARPSPGTVAWGRRLGDALNNNDEFREAARAFDGAVALSVGANNVVLKMFEGDVLKTASRLATGETFTVAATEMVWLDFIRRERNEFVAMASTGAFAVRGNVYEYLRLTRALMMILDEARKL